MKSAYTLLNAFIIFLSLAGTALSGMEKPPKQEEIKHLPCIFLFDQRRQEVAPSGNYIKSVKFEQMNVFTQHLYYSLQNSLGLIIASASLLENVVLLSDMNIQNQAFVYDIPESELILLVPKNIANTYQQRISTQDILNNLQLQKLKQLSKNGQELINEIKKEKNIQSFGKQPWPEEMSIFKNVFKMKLGNDSDDALPIWDIVIGGHGLAQNNLIADLNPDQINELFDFFNNKIRVGVVYLISCQIGGRPLVKIEMEDERFFRSRNFIVIAGSIGEENVYPVLHKLHDFFRLAANINNRGISLDALMTLLSLPARTDVSSIQKTADLPQIWIPGLVGFTTLSGIREVLVIGNAAVIKHKEDTTPLLIQGKRAVLLYPQVLPITLEIRPIVIESKQNIWPKNLQMKFATERKGDDVYPRIISMTREPHRRHYIKKVELGTTQGGVLQFIRDSFLNTKDERAFSVVIEEVHGINDLVSQLPENHPLKSKLSSANDKVITLKKVLISSSANSFDINFEVNDTSWAYANYSSNWDLLKSKSYNFEIQKDDIIQSFNIPEQKPISKVVTDFMKENKITSLSKEKLLGRIVEQRSKNVEGTLNQAQSVQELLLLVARNNIQDTEKVARILREKFSQDEIKAAFVTELEQTAQDKELLKILLNAGANINDTFLDPRKVEEIPVTPLINAVKKEKVKQIAILLDLGADINKQDSRDMTPLMIAASKARGGARITRQLLDAGADPNIKNNEGNTALMLAVELADPDKKEDYIDIVKLLVERGTDLSIKNNANETVFDIDYENDKIDEFRDILAKALRS